MPTLLNPVFFLALKLQYILSLFGSLYIRGRKAHRLQREQFPLLCFFTRSVEIIYDAILHMVAQKHFHELIEIQWYLQMMCEKQLKLQDTRSSSSMP
ncbi:unnamed protein product [Brassica rapa]|uniref:Uncharacterized protein n=1 Tax=Brassica campestris TaxID=3711 RepID=A0A8D9GEF8_BRACM|nr:unnamed protein product [Brassica rapa]CAG7879465.1 unnamed protein product [Brassica rapa]